ncbi:uncharacterized protein FTOL_11173 [Fusarium torulosum]|uniref:Uncharacterized protein n=1 Tax=Fusarium torulosum TaxID=33205 RepID=A0AAE8SMM3_9HYPO|nr:uncharacterized protein FTOL_11173 [Fusarium torulosum]
MSLVQIQWSIDNTIFKSGEVLLKLFQAARDDDVQGSAIMALEALGSSLMVCPDRLDEARAALSNTSHFQALQDALVTIGLTAGGVAYFVRKTATQGIPAFVLATSLKAFFGDEAVGNILYEMLACYCLNRKPELRCSRDQLSKVVSSLSGYTDSIIPNTTVQNLVSCLRRHSKPGDDWLEGAWAQPSPKQLANIYSAVYAALQKEDVDLVTLTGHSGCIIVSSTLLWLQEDDAQFVVDGQVLIPSRTIPPKISIQLSTKIPSQKAAWTIQEWSEATEISNLVVEDAGSPGQSSQLPSFVPASTAKEILRAQYQLSETQTAQVGKIATALVLVATERGLVTLTPNIEGQIPREVKLKAFCQTSYLTKVGECMSCYGWDDGELSEATKIADQIKEWTEQGFPGLPLDEIKAPHPLTQKPIDHIAWIVEFIINRWYTKIGVTDVKIGREVSEAAIYIAAESLYTSVCSRFPTQRFFRVGKFSSITYNGATMMHWIVRHEGLRGRSDTPAPIAKLVSYVVESVSLGQLRCDCMGSLVPGVSNMEYIAEYSSLTSEKAVHRSDLAYAMNGYVAWIPQLRSISTLERSAFVVEICPGYLRYAGVEGGQDYNDLLRIQADESLVEYSDGNGQGLTATHLNPFDIKGGYVGLKPFTDTEGLQVKHYWNQDGRVLHLRTNVVHPSTGRVRPMNWMASIEALASATHLTTNPMPSFAEEATAQAWKSENVWSTICSASVACTSLPVSSNGTHVRCISQTWGNEELRFFLAGIVSHHRLYVCHGDGSMVKCIQTALDGEADPSGRAMWWDKWPGASTKAMPWMNPSVAEQLVNPGWFIIS